MNPKTLKTLLWTAIVTMLIGMTVMSPVAGFALSLLSTIFSAFPAFFGAKWMRVAGISVLALSLLLSVVTYSTYDTEMTSYRTRAKKTSGTKPEAVPDKAIKPP